jgi:hypothetical protein
MVKFSRYHFIVCLNLKVATLPNTLAILARLRFFDENYKEEDAINRRLYNNHCFVLTAIYRVFYPNRTVLVGDLIVHE